MSAPDPAVRQGWEGNSRFWFTATSAVLDRYQRIKARYRQAVRVDLHHGVFSCALAAALCGCADLPTGETLLSGTAPVAPAAAGLIAVVPVRTSPPLQTRGAEVTAAGAVGGSAIRGAVEGPVQAMILDPRIAVYAAANPEFFVILMPPMAVAGAISGAMIYALSAKDRARLAKAQDSISQRLYGGTLALQIAERVAAQARQRALPGIADWDPALAAQAGENPGALAGLVDSALEIAVTRVAITNPRGEPALASDGSVAPALVFRVEAQARIYRLEGGAELVKVSFLHIGEVFNVKGWFGQVDEPFFERTLATAADDLAQRVARTLLGAGPAR
jgi:hypothetical protein